MLVLLGVAVDDTRTEAEWIARKLRALRIFDDAEGRMNEPLGGRGPVREPVHAARGGFEGQLPSWGRAAPGEAARPLYETVCELLDQQQGLFGAHMEVDLVNDGPVTILVESPPSG